MTKVGVVPCRFTGIHKKSDVTTYIRVLSNTWVSKDDSDLNAGINSHSVENLLLIQGLLR